MHERGCYITSGDTILNKLNLGITIKNLAFIVSKSQNLILGYGELFNNEFDNKYRNCKEDYEKKWGKAVADDIRILPFSQKCGYFNADELCSFLNYVTTKNHIKICDLLNLPEIRLKEFIGKIQFLGY